MEVVKPPKLKPGDSVGLVSPSNSIQPRFDDFNKSVKRFESEMNLKIKIAPHAMGEHYYSSGTVKERLDDFHAMIADPTIKGVLFSVGGETAIELVDKIDYPLIKDNPKIIAGISDALTLLNPITTRTGLVTFAGLEFTSVASHYTKYGFDSMKKAWFEGDIGEVKLNQGWKDFAGNPTKYNGWKTIKNGKASGRLFGVNFGATFQLLNTAYGIDLSDTILVMETYRLHKKSIHRALFSLRLHGILDKIKGLLLGYLVGSDDPEYPGDERDLKELVLEATDGYDFPIMQIGEVGHYVENTQIPVGAKATIDATDLKFRIDESVCV